MSASMSLNPKPGFSKPDGPVALIVLDGVGIAPDAPWNAVTQAHTPFLDGLMAGKGPEGLPSLYMEIDASGKSVGLPTMGDMGNSEVGHNALGAGRVFDQGAKLVNNAFQTGNFKSDVWRWLVEPCAGADAGTLHLMGLYSDGNVHAHVNHVFQLIDAAVDDGVKRIRLHLLADGRDVSERSALDYFGPLEKRLEALRENGVDARVASGGGRMTCTMDRYEADWPMVERGWRAHALGDTTLATFPSSIAAVDAFYKDASMADQYFPAFVIVDDAGSAVGPVQDGDSVLFWNFRGDRSIEISMAFEAEEGAFSHFDRVRVPKTRYAGMMQYDGDANIPARFLVAPPSIDHTVGEYCISNGLKRYSVSETQKYGHVTYFFNGNRAAKFNERLEKYTCIPSYTEREHTRPWMRAAEISDEIVKELDDFKPDLMVINYPNGDMVGHTGHMEAARIAMECMDLCLARVVPELVARGAMVIMTADHGNCDIMAELGKDNQPKPGSGPEGWKRKVSHTKQRVPVMITGRDIEKYELNTEVRWSTTDPDCKYPGIVNLSATTLNLLGLETPEGYLPGVLKPKA